MRAAAYLLLAALFTLPGCNSYKVAIEPSPIFYSDQVAMIGIEGKIGILGPEFVANQSNKYMWHFWGTQEELENGPFRVEAINVKSKQKVKALVAEAGTSQERLVWEYDSITGPNNGADAHRPSI